MFLKTSAEHKDRYDALVFRRDHLYNVAVLRLKTKLIFTHKSSYLPICLPPRCDGEHECRTRDGDMKRDLIGMKTVSTHGNYRGNTNLRIITNKQCNYINSVQESGNTGIRSIRRYIIIYYIIDPIRPKITRVTFFYCL